jgi:glycerate kinase
MVDVIHNPTTCSMKIVAAPNAFKGCLTARDAAAAMAAGARRAAPDAEIVELPVADGGDGLVAVIAAARGGVLRQCEVTGPLGDRVSASICQAGDLVTIEMALASGLALVPPERRDAVAASTLGTGELILHALDLGAKTLVIGLGGSATTDGGIGMAHALGARFFDAAGTPLDPSGAALPLIERIDLSGLDPRLDTTVLEAACDVDNPLYGPRGAASIFGPQKGATPDQVAFLDNGLRNLARVIKRDLGRDVASVPGAGAAGGLGASLLAFFGATLKPGAELVMEIVGLDRALEGADLVLTGEGAVDAQTVFGKAPAIVAARAKAKGAACFIIAGRKSADLGQLRALGADAVFSLCPGPMSLDDAMAQARPLLADAAEDATRAFLAGKRRNIDKPHVQTMSSRKRGR